MKKVILPILSVLGGLLPLSATHAATLPFMVKNTSSFFLHQQSDSLSPNCPSVIKPGETVAVNDYWCGYDACATAGFDSKKGCLEHGVDKDQKPVETEGGYATWFSISPGAQPTPLCTVPAGNTYACTLKNAGGVLNFSMDYIPMKQTYSAGPHKGDDVVLPKPLSKYNNGPAFRGVNISGLEYDGTFLDALYQHPDLPDVRYFAEQGMNTIRLPIRWEFIVSSTPDNFIESANPISKSINTMYLNAVYETVEKYLKSGLTVDLDMHNYMRFCSAGKDIGQLNEPTDPVTNKCQVMNADQLAYIWGVVAEKFAPLAKQYPDNLMFELMNEPYTYVDKDDKPVAGQIIKTEELLTMEAAAVKAIRAHDLNNYILLSGNYWDPLHGWIDHAIEGDVPNGTVFTAEKLQAAGVTDLSRIIIDMHQYFDVNYSGTHHDCRKYESYGAFKEELVLEKSGVDIFGNWLKANHMKIFLGEFGASDDAICQEDLNFMMRYVNEHAYDSATPNNGGFIGWTAWRGNRHGNDAAFSPFNFLQAEDVNVYGADGSTASAGKGIVKGGGNALMDQLFAKYLVKAAK